MDAILLLILVAIALLVLGLQLLGRKESHSLTEPMPALRFWLGIAALAAVLAICVLFLVALFSG